MKRGFPTDPSRLGPVYEWSSAGGDHPLTRVEPPEPTGAHYRRRSSGLSAADSGLGASFLTSSYDSPMQTGNNWTSVEVTPKSANRSDLSSLNTPHPRSASATKPHHFLINSQEASPIGHLRACKDEPGVSSPSLSLSKTSGVTEFRFDGSQINNLASSGLIKIGSPQTECLETPKTERRYETHKENGRGGINRKLPMPAPSTPSKLLPDSPTKGFGLFDTFGASTSTPLRGLAPDLDPLQPMLQPLPHLDAAALRPPPQATQLRSPVPGTKRPPPLTPTPIKRAMAKINHKKTPPPNLADLDELIRADSAGSSGMVGSGIEYTTPSKIMRWDAGLEPYPLPGLYHPIPPRSPLQPLHPHPPVQLNLPDHTPEKMSAAWCRIALGKTSPQRELTEQARSFLSAYQTYTHL